MDWKYTLSLTPSALSNNDKDELLNTIAWYDCDEENLDKIKLKSIFKISQEILKYKSEQVESLLAELDEIATRQAQEELRKGSDFDIRSLKSRKSHSSFDVEEYENKIKDLKSKVKQINKQYEKSNKEIEKLKKQIKSLQDDKIFLQNELENLNQEDSHSDISETIKDQHNSLVDTIKEKNKQISQLLDDMEAIENDNNTLRDKISTLRDQLTEATKQISQLNNEIVASNILIEEKSDIINNMTHEIAALNEDIEEMEKEKQTKNKEIEEFTQEVDSRIDEWKKILEDKNNEIKELKIVQHQKVSSGSSTKSIMEYDQSEITALHIALKDREEKLLIMQEQLVTATKDIEENSKYIENLTTERNSNLLKINEKSCMIKELQTQLKASHTRQVDLEERVAHLEKIYFAKEADLKNLIHKIKEEGNIELSEYIKTTQDLKSQLYSQEKQIHNLVKSCNKLQDTVENLDLENAALRSRLGLNDDDEVIVNGVIAKRRKEKKIIEKLKTKIANLEEEKLELRLDIQKGSKYQTNETDLNNVLQNGDKVDNHEKHKEVIEENEALRKGLHEILDAIQANKGSHKIESKTLEKLIHTLDVKHISGWYHPAMRLQAELHKLQGINTEIRNELQNTRDELKLYKEHGLELRKDSIKPDIYNLQKLPQMLSSNNAELISNLNTHLLNVLNNYHVQETTNQNLMHNVEFYNGEFKIIQKQLNFLYQQYLAEKSLWSSKENEIKEENNVIVEQMEVLKAQLTEATDFKNLSEEDRAKAEKLTEISANLVVLNRKCLYLKNQEKTYFDEIVKLKEDLCKAEEVITEKISLFTQKEISLKNKISILENKQKDTIDSKTAIELQNNLDRIIVNHRLLLHNFDEIKDKYNLEMKHNNESKNALSRENEELKQKLTDTLCQLHSIEVVSCDLEPSAEILTKKLAQVEVNEITERQRANHTNNLYELVKEQLRNSEERYVEFEKFSKELMHKNLSLQETIKVLEDKVCYFIDVNIFKETQDTCAKLLKENEKLSIENNKLSSKIQSLEATVQTHKLWSSAQEYEYLSLKHQIVDLQSATDDKAVIARLSSDVVNARLAEAEMKKFTDLLKQELNCLREENFNYLKQIDNEKIKNLELSRHFEEKIRIFLEVIQHQRLNFYGYLPYVSEYRFVENICQIVVDKHNAFLSLQKAQNTEHEVNVLKQQLKVQLNQLNNVLTEEGDIKDKINDWVRDKSNVQIQELKYRRQCEFKETQLQQTISRLNVQDDQIVQLEQELLKTLNMKDTVKMSVSKDIFESPVKPNKIDKATSMTKPLDSDLIIKSSKSSQTIPQTPLSNEISSNISIMENLQTELTKCQNEILAKEKMIQDLRSKITELEMNVSLFRNQIGDKQSQITFYEKYILELQAKKENSHSTNIQEINLKDSNEEITNLKESIAELKLLILQKDEALVEYQSLLKKDRDEHSLAAARMQEEVKRLQSILTSQQQAYNKLKDVKPEAQPSKVVIEQYFQQVHALEKHSADIHLAMKKVTLELEETKGEVQKWKLLAQERLGKLNEVDNDFEVANEKNANIYKQECEKWKQEVLNLKKLVEECRSRSESIKPVEELLREKDQKINELLTTVRQVKVQLSKRQESVSSDSTRLSELEAENEQLFKDMEKFKKRFEQLMKKDKTSREEIRSLKGQLIKRPLVSARSDKSDNSSKEQNLLKKMSLLENESKELKEQLEKQLLVNESHRMKVAENFDKWNKMKHFQQTADKYKNKLKTKEQDFLKLQQTCNGYRILIERLEREKHGLEARLKNLRNSCQSVNLARINMLELENTKLQAEITSVSSKMGMQHYHSGGLGAAMLQEKLEAQERKIAILELSAKGTGEIRAEMERLQNTIASLQKANLRLEAENLELNLDLQKSGNDTPHLREQIQHLENYIEVLKAENSNKNEVTGTADHPAPNGESKKATELERTVFVLKRLVEKLQAENKRLQSGARVCTVSGRIASEEKLRNDLKQTKEQYGESVQKISRLEQELQASQAKIKALENKPVSYSFTALSQELSEVKGQLSQKTQLLDKVKTLLQRAAAKEKALLEEVASLRLQLSS